jgi:hypothetical protein
MLAGVVAGVPAAAVTVTYVATLDGPSEEPPNASPATGRGRVDIDLDTDFLRVRFAFDGLLAGLTVAHIHGPTLMPREGVAGVMTTTPSFPDLPVGATSGTYDRIFNLGELSTFNPSFVTAQGSLAAAVSTFAASLADGRAYLNLHSEQFQGGEIRGFLAPIPLPAALWLMVAGVAGIAAMGRRTT